MALLTHIDPATCNHIWSDSEYAPEYDHQPTAFETRDARDSTVMRAKDTRVHEIVRWKHTCKKCGTVEYYYGHKRI